MNDQVGVGRDGGEFHKVTNIPNKTTGAEANVPRKGNWKKARDAREFR